MHSQLLPCNDPLCALPLCLTRPCSEFVNDDCANPFKRGGGLQVDTLTSGTWYEIDAMLPNGVCGKASVVSGDWTGTIDGESQDELTGSIRFIAGFVDEDGNVLCPPAANPATITPRKTNLGKHPRFPQVTCGQLQIFLD